MVLQIALWSTEEKKIFWNIINSILAGGLVFLGSLTSGDITVQGLIGGMIASGIVAITKFRDYWQTVENEIKEPERTITASIFHFL